MDRFISESFGRAINLFQQGQLEAAIEECRKILAQRPFHVDALQMTGLSYARLGRNDLAVEPLEKALHYQPNLPALCNNLGELYRQVGRLADAEKLLRQAMTLQPQFAEAAMNLGNCLKDQDRYADAIESFQSAVDWRPTYANAHLNLANTMLKEGRAKRAVQHYLEYLRLQPPKCDILLSLGGAYADLGERDNATRYYQQAAALEPDNAEVDAALGSDWLTRGEITQATHYFRRISDRQPGSLLKRLRTESLCEIIPPSNEYIDDYRARLSETLDCLQTESLELEFDKLQSSGVEPPMALAYQGRDDRAIKEQYAKLFSQKINPVELPRRTGKPHLGVVVTNGHEGVYAECLGRLVARLAKSPEMDVTVVCSRAGANIIPYLLGESPVRYLPLPDGIAESAARIVQSGIDLLHYWEVGTDSTNYLLPYFRPAAVQSACWGWPVTTGQPHIQYFVSSRWIEPDDSAAHYTEQVVALETLPTWYARPPVPQPLRSRSTFGWPEKGRIYFCTQNLRKYHPDFDPILADILRKDPEGRVYAIEDAQPTISRRFHDRFAKGFPDVATRLVMVPRKERVDYLNLVALADVILDTPHYGGGANSLYDAFACGTPIVTRPGPFHRSRYGQAICRKLDLPELIASSGDDYVTRAIQIASEADFRRDLQQRIHQRAQELFEDDLAVKQHEQFFLDAIARSRNV